MYHTLISSISLENPLAIPMASMQATLFFIPCLVVRSHICDMYEGVGDSLSKP